MFYSFVAGGALLTVAGLTAYLLFVVPRSRAEDAAINRRIQTADERRLQLDQALAAQARRREEDERKQVLTQIADGEARPWDKRRQ